MTIGSSQLIGHLMRRRLLIWIFTLLLIAMFSAAAAAILWNVRMNVTYQGEVIPRGAGEWSGLFSVLIPASRFQSIREGEPVIITSAGESNISGTVRSVRSGTKKTELKISLPKKPEETTDVAITLRGERLIAAFLNR